jgi:hypothetical protein
LYIHTLTYLYAPSNINISGISMTDMEQLNDVDDDDNGNEIRQGGEANI